MAAAKRLALQSKKRRSSKGFTLLELLVVSAIIAILASIVLPALSRTKARGYTVVCLNNHRQLALAWNLYPADNEDALPPNMGVSGTADTVATGQNRNWANNVMSWDLDPLNTNLHPVAAGGLGPYLSGVVQPFRCPSDRVLSHTQKSAGWRERGRSYSMNAMLGNPGEFLKDGKNTNNPTYKQFFRASEIPDPASIFVFIDEHPDSINDGYFLFKVAYYGQKWYDLPAAYHQGGANVTFADMHVEFRKWLSPSTVQPITTEQLALPIAIPTGELSDYTWLKERTSYRDVYNYAGVEGYGK